MVARGMCGRDMVHEHALARHAARPSTPSSAGCAPLKVRWFRTTWIATPREGRSRARQGLDTYRKTPIKRKVPIEGTQEMRANLKLVETTPSTVNRKVARSEAQTPSRPTNASLRP